MTMKQPIDSAPKDGTKILAWDADDSEPYITSWTDDAWKAQGGSGGPSGWFHGKYRDRWGDYPLIDRPVTWMPLP